MCIYILITTPAASIIMKQKFKKKRDHSFIRVAKMAQIMWPVKKQTNGYICNPEVGKIVITIALNTTNAVAIHFNPPCHFLFAVKLIHI